MIDIIHDNVYPDVCSAAGSLSPEHRYAFVKADFFQENKELQESKILRDADIDISFPKQDIEHDKERVFSAVFKNSTEDCTSELNNESIAASKIVQDMYVFQNSFQKCPFTEFGYNPVAFFLNGKPEFERLKRPFFHQDDNSAFLVRAFYSFKGAKTLFKNHTNGAIETAPDNHIVVFTQGYKFGAWHAAPMINLPELYAKGFNSTDYERLLGSVHFMVNLFDKLINSDL